ncbi:DUF423 domain-containing protein [Myroides ceti]|uniref:DUF423 domain-containing protein n=1 Tax=Paenimyroides ceti TaxID=395087 RepID=A0ABT8CYH7_9FLAO|nr:DUF423 domain-containing protein [Paenimyroides ceti]MDN3708217.1 DUF423 domain-containing protein [Paenimyroides ceti]
MNRKIVITAAVLGLISIVLGAFGAHALKKVLTVEQLVSFETGVRYQMYHALFLLFVGTTQFLTEKAKKYVYYTALTGVILFSGSIFLLATQEISQINFRFLGPVTPIGGVFLISSWLLLAVHVCKQKTHN